MTDHLKTKHELKEDPCLYSKMMNSELLSDEDKKILKMIYVDGHDYRLIGDTIGVSESTVKKRHSRILKKVSKILKAGL